MKRSLNLLWICVVTCGWSLATPALGLAQEADATRLQIQAWGLPARGTVTEVKLERGREVTLRYQVELSEDESGELRLRFDALELLEVDGRDLTSPALAEAVRRQVASLRGSFPTLRISRDGEFLGVVDWEHHVDQTIRSLRELSGRSDQAELEATRSMLLDPRFRAMLEAKSGETWQVWVQAWVGFDLAPGETADAVSELPVGQEWVEASVVLEHRGETADGAVQLSMVTTLAGQEAMAAFRRMMVDLTRDGPNPMTPEQLAQFEEFSKRTTLTVTTDPDSLRPLEATSESLDLVAGDGERHEQVERHRYTFDWDD
jgi:hypothetical protein